MNFSERYIIMYGEFPVTNHADADEGNLGWVKGVFDDGLPFEAELWEYEGHTNVSILIPADCRDIEGNANWEDNDIIQFHGKRKSVNGGVLVVGMVSLGFETDDNIICNWIDYLEEKEFIDFIDEWRNGAIQYVVDINGNTFCEIIVELENENRVYAEVDIGWNEFPMRKKNTNKNRPFTIVLGENNYDI